MDEINNCGNFDRIKTSFESVLTASSISNEAKTTVIEVEKKIQLADDESIDE